jgi:octaprenyl-diphosphate synthase
MLAADTRSSGTRFAPGRGISQGAELWEEIQGHATGFLKEVQKRLEQEVETFEPEVAEGARYALSTSGKQLRPLLVALSGQSAGGLVHGHVSAALIIEMVHLATLVHDDVIDEAHMRRRQPTVAATWGNQTAVLLGDCLFAHALGLAASFPTPEVCRAVAAATQQVCSGEILQTLRGLKFGGGLESYFRVIEMKTAELFALACDLGAMLASAEPAVREALRGFGRAFGTAYQVFDDCLDVFGSEAKTGKTLGTDLANGRLTLPLLLAWQTAEPTERLWLEELATVPSGARATAARDRLRRSEIALQCVRHGEAHLHAASQALAMLPVSDQRRSLERLSEYLLGQMQALACP